MNHPKPKWEDLPRRDLDEGEVLLAEGEPADALYFLEEGAVEVVKGGVCLCRIRERGAVFGEMSALLSLPCTATVRTLRPSAFRTVPDAVRFMQERPDISVYISRVLASRLEAMNRYLLDVRAQFEQFDDHVGMVDEVIETLSHRQPRKVERRPLAGP